MNKNQLGKDVVRKVLYLGFCLPAKIQSELEKIDSSPHFATYNFSWSLVRSLKIAYPQVDVISAVEVRNFPGARRIFFPTTAGVENTVNVSVMGFINLIFLKHISRLFQLIFRFSYLKMAFSRDLLVVHGTHTPFLLYAQTFSMFGKKTLLVLTDRHGAKVESDGYFGVLLRRIDFVVMKALITRFDGYFCLNKTFIDFFGLKNTVCIPGILAIDVESIPKRTQSEPLKTAQFTVLFAGNLTRDNGVDLLLNAFSEIKDPDMVLEIFGAGDLAERVEVAAMMDNRIRFAGTTNRDVLLKRMRNADLLINPRRPNDRKNKFSFPSKLIEFGGIGTLTLTGKAPSVPEELSDCFLYFEGDDSSAIIDGIYQARLLSIDEREAIALRAYKTIRELYSEEAVAAKIMSLYAHDN